jgi:hypothetical protein
MSDIQADPPEVDPLEELLRPHPLPADGEALRQGLRQRTTRWVRRRQRLRLLAWVAALVSCYFAGLATLRVPRLVPRPTEPIARQAARTPSAAELEWQALEGTRGKAERYRAAGDRYLEEADPEGAVRCYGASLDEATEEERTISASDSWLLLAIKEARQKEKDDAKKGG